MPESEHVLKEAPYLLTDANRRGWGLRCSCGWRSPLLDTSEDALAEGQRHLLHPDVDRPSSEKKGLLAWWGRLMRSPSEERRRD